MKKWIGLLICICMFLTLGACGGEKQNKEWSREGYFQDENENTLEISASQYPDDYPGYYVGLFVDGDAYGYYIQQEGDALHGDIRIDEDDDPYIVTVKEEGEDGIVLLVEGGETYHFKPMDIPEATIFVSVNTEGRGNIEYTEGEETPIIDEEARYQSAQINIAEPEVHTFLAYPDRGSRFVKWTKDGEDYSTDAQITVNLDASADFIAVFEEDENYVDPLDAYVGRYQCDRANADVTFSDETFFVIIEWAKNANELGQWTIVGEIDEETMSANYEEAINKILTYDEDGELAKEDIQYEDGTGSITFAKDGQSFIWHEDNGQNGDMTFVKLPDSE